MPTDRAPLPLFPLGTVLVPGLVLPLVLFEPRYLDLARDLQALPEEERAFIVVAIREGHEVGSDAIRSLHAVGTVAEVRDMTPLPDGRVEVVTVGSRRMRLGELTGDAAYLSAIAEEVPELPGADPHGAALAVRRRFAEYRRLLAGDPAADGTAGPPAEAAAVPADVAAGADRGLGVDPDLPDDPGVLSYLVTAAMVLDLAERQSLLEVPDDTERLHRAHQVLSREIAVIRGLPSLPATDLARMRPSPN